MAAGQQGELVAVVNDTDPKSNGKAYSLKISGNNHSQLLGKKIGEVVDGIFVGEGDKTLSGYKLQITGGSDKTGTPLRRDLEGGSRQSILVTRSTGFKGHNLCLRQKVAKRRFRYKPDGLRKKKLQRKHNHTRYTTNQSKGN